MVYTLSAVCRWYRVLVCLFLFPHGVQRSACCAVCFRRFRLCSCSLSEEHAFIHSSAVYALFALYLPVSGVFSVPAYICTIIINVPKIGVKTIFYNRAQYEHSYNAMASGMVLTGIALLSCICLVLAFLWFGWYLIP